MKKVDFMIIGAQKAGTTALYSYLNRHENVSMANRKEVHFFDNDAIFTNQPIDYKKYHAHFNLNEKECIFGEATPIYMYWDNCIQRIYDYNKNAKLLISLRDPMYRAFSHWNMEISRNADHMSFWRAIKTENKRIRSGGQKQHRVYSYVDRGFYSRQLEKIYSIFPKEQIHVVKQEDLLENTQRTMDDICNFLNISYFSYIESKRIFCGEYTKKIGKKEKEYLKNIYKEEIIVLEKMLNWDCGNWLH